MTKHNEVQNVPSDALTEEDLRLLFSMFGWKTAGGRELRFDMFKDAVGIAVKKVMKSAFSAPAPLVPLTLSLSPDPRGVHVAVHQGSEFVQSEAMALPGAVGQGVPNTGLIATDDRSMLNYLHQAFQSEMSVCERCHNEEPTADFDSASFLRDYLAAYPTPPAGEGQEPVAPTWAMIRDHLGSEVADTLCVTRWKDGIDIQEPVAGLVKLIAACHPAPQAAQGDACEHSEHARPADGVCVECGDVVAKPAQDEREAFERAIDDDAADCGETGFFDFTLDAVGRYMAPGLESAWWAWQARAALSTPPTGADDDDSTNLQIECAMSLVLHQTGAGTYYMDIPDGGNVLASEQVLRMGLDAKRYRAWRDAAVSNNDAFARALKAALPPEAREGKPRWPTADEWDAAVDAAIASMGKGPTCEN